MEMIVSNVCLLLTSQSREVVGASLSFLHVFVTTNDVLKSAQHVEGNNKLQITVIKITV